MKLWSMIAAMLLLVSATSADLIPTLNYPAGVTLVVPGIWQFKYTIDLTTDERIDPAGSANPTTFTVYDVSGFTGVHSEPANWAFSFANLGLKPSSVIAADDPAIPNLTVPTSSSTTMPVKLRKTPV